MLRLKNITKNYKVAGGEIEVLKGLNVCFRKNEFVSILGPSGCGKTTTLNIVGGLDKYTDGDLIIQGRSTKNFKDHDWDVYRNQRIGFIFQSYNLIPHQTVLGNVELSLTISGISKEERIKRSLKALERVGLKGEEYKRPNQLSGGQCQRVAIARALVNEPDILLADEPTGALDSKTSVQIMDLIKEIANDRLVIMVTHNGELAEQYSNRIIRLVDGEIVEDTNPFSVEDQEKEVEEINAKTVDLPKKKNKAKMSWWTAFKLSTRNLLSKAKRTVLTSVAGSIGIIGISAVLAVSSGVTGYIDSMQDDMLSGNPITIEESGYDLNAMMSNMQFEDSVELVKKQGYVNVESMMEFLVKQSETLNSFMVENDITPEYVEYVKQIDKDVASLKLDYGLDVTNNIYTEFARNNEFKETVSLSAIKSIYASVMKETSYKDNATMISTLGETFMLAPNDNDYIKSQYNVLSGELADAKDEIMLVVSKDRAVADLTLAQLGYYTQDQFMNVAFTLDDVEGNENPALNRGDFTYEELMGKTFTWYNNDVVYNDVRSSDVLGTNPFTYNYKKDDTFGQGLELKIVGILEPKEDINFGCLTTGFYYTDGLVDYAIENNINSAIATYLNDISNPESPNYKEMYKSGYTSGKNPYTNTPTGITYEFKYYYDNNYNDNIAPEIKDGVGYVGSMDAMSNIMSSFIPGMGATESYVLTARNVAGVGYANSISIYPKSFDMKDLVIEHLDAWNEEGNIVVLGKTLTLEERAEITYTDTLSLIMTMIDSMIDIVTYALIAFTSLSLVVSCVMIAIITYVSVVERVKEIGVIRSLGGRKKDVSNLFNAETLIIGLASGLFGVGVTYLLSFIVNLILKGLAGFNIMALPILSALIMVALAVVLTVLSGLIPAKKAAQQDPVVALRTE